MSNMLQGLQSLYSLNRSPVQTTQIKEPHKEVQTEKKEPVQRTSPKKTSFWNGRTLALAALGIGAVGMALYFLNQQKALPISPPSMPQGKLAQEDPNACSIFEPLLGSSVCSADGSAPMKKEDLSAKKIFDVCLKEDAPKGFETYPALNSTLIQNMPFSKRAKAGPEPVRLKDKGQESLEIGTPRNFWEELAAFNGSSSQSLPGTHLESSQDMLSSTSDIDSEQALQNLECLRARMELAGIDSTLIQSVSKDDFNDSLQIGVDSSWATQNPEAYARWQEYAKKHQLADLALNPKDLEDGSLFRTNTTAYFARNKSKMINPHIHLPECARREKSEVQAWKDRFVEWGVPSQIVDAFGGEGMNDWAKRCSAPELQNQLNKARRYEVQQEFKGRNINPNSVMQALREKDCRKLFAIKTHPYVLSEKEREDRDQKCADLILAGSQLENSSDLLARLVGMRLESNPKVLEAGIEDLVEEAANGIIEEIRQSINSCQSVIERIEEATDFEREYVLPVKDLFLNPMRKFLNSFVDAHG